MKDTEKVNLNTNIALETERELERLQRELRDKGTARRATAKGALLDILVLCPEAQQILEREVV